MCMTKESDADKDPIEAFCNYMIDLHMIEIIMGMYSAIELCEASDCDKCPFTVQECIVMRDNIDDEVAEDWLDRWAKMTGRSVDECKVIMNRGFAVMREFMKQLYNKPVETANPGLNRLEGGLENDDGSEHK